MLNIWGLAMTDWTKRKAVDIGATVAFLFAIAWRVGVYVTGRRDLAEDWILWAGAVVGFGVLILIGLLRSRLRERKTGAGDVT